MFAALTLGVLTEQAQQALLLAAAVSLPLLLVSALVGLLVSMFQGTFQLQDALLVHVPRLILVGFSLLWLGPWMGRTIVAFSIRMFTGD
jgi:flagellar biosynthetic protein FliQ